MSETRDLKFEYTTRGNYLLFWNGHFSNWYPASFTLDGVQFNCAEKYMMYMKAKTFNDDNSAALILQTKDPGVQKALGRKVANFDPVAWDKVREDVVYHGCLAKYTQNPSLKEEMLKTGDMILVEASPYDKIWGIGLSENHPDAADESKWQGQNLLGKVLMRVRDTLRNQK
jgi:ribA/ribD-fused uncharacterized protein